MAMTETLGTFKTGIYFRYFETLGFMVVLMFWVRGVEGSEVFKDQNQPYIKIRIGILVTF